MRKFLNGLAEIDIWSLTLAVWVLTNLVQCSVTASSDSGVSVGVQTRQEAPEEPKKQISTDDGPKASW